MKLKQLTIIKFLTLCLGPAAGSMLQSTHAAETWTG